MPHRKKSTVTRMNGIKYCRGINGGWSFPSLASDSTCNCCDPEDPALIAVINPYTRTHKAQRPATIFAYRKRINAFEDTRRLRVANRKAYGQPLLLHMARLQPNPLSIPRPMSS